MAINLPRQVRRRTRGRCQYYRTPQAYDDLLFGLDDIPARKHGRRTTLGNLALSCFHCNSYKGRLCP